MGNNTFLAEGLRSGDLSNIVLPLVSIDEFESKVDDDAIVIGFYVTDQDGGDDLNRFIQRSPIDILDSEVSSAPDQNGHFMVFVEILGSDEVADNIVDLIDEVGPLCGIDAWEAQIRGRDDVISVTKNDVAACLDENRRFDLEQKQQDTKPGGKASVSEALRRSDLRALQVLDNGERTLITCGPTDLRETYKVIAVGSRCTIMEECENLGGDLSLEAVSRASKIRRRLGYGWDVDCIGAMQIWQSDDGTCLLVREIA